MNSAPENRDLPDEEWNEFDDDIVDSSLEEAHEHRQWQPLGNGGFLDAYRKVKAHLLLRFRCGDSEEFIACIQRDWRKEVLSYDAWESLSELWNKDFWKASRHCRFLSWSEGAHRAYMAHGQEKTVLVDVIKPMELPQEEIPSLVWLDTVEHFESILAYSWYQSSEAGFIAFGRVEDWELRVGCDIGDKPAGEVIERAAEVVENVAKDQWNFGGDGRKLSDVIAEVSGLRVRLGKDGNRVEIVINPESRIELVDMLLGPNELG